MHSTETIEPLNWQTLQPLFTTLLKKISQLNVFPSWLHRWSALEKIVWEARAHLKRDTVLG